MVRESVQYVPIFIINVRCTVCGVSWIVVYRKEEPGQNIAVAVQRLSDEKLSQLISRFQF